MLCDQAVALLGAIQDEQVIACLIEAMSNNPAVARATITALRRMTGEDAGNTAAEWAQWYQRRQQPAIRTVGPAPPGALRIIVPTPGEIEMMGE
jgi:HEAT repeat protein